MKKKSIGVIALLTIALTFVFAMNLRAVNQHQNPNENALADGGPAPTGGGGTAVNKCYKQVTPKEGTGRSYIKCNSQTSSSMIYPCPATTKGDANEFNTSMCTT